MATGLAVMLAPAFVRRWFGQGSAYSAFTDPTHPGTAHGMDLFTPERPRDRILRGIHEG